ncbi:hypothetical protein U1Q18_016411, partial [Sarracenia purpurea var. burkii]
MGGDATIAPPLQQSPSCHQSKGSVFLIFLQFEAWKKWRAQITKLDCSAFWVQCGHRQTREGLKNLLQIMLGNDNTLSSATCHWIELHIYHLLFFKPFTMGIERSEKERRRREKESRRNG